MIIYLFIYLSIYLFIHLFIGWLVEVIQVFLFYFILFVGKLSFMKLECHV